MLVADNNEYVKSVLRKALGDDTANMLIARPALFALYASELFTVIDQIYARVGVKPDIDGARYQPTRYPCLLSERFMAAFINAHRLKPFEAQMLFIDGL